MKDFLFILVGRLLKKNNISFDKKEFDFQIQSHPSYPSLYAITGVLDHFNIENVAADVPVNLETLEQLPDCFLAQVSFDNGKDLAIVEKIKGINEIQVFSSDETKKNINAKDFLKAFTGIIVAVEKNENSPVTTSSSNLINKVLLSVIVTSLILYLVNTNYNFYNLSFFLFSVIGIILSISIVRQEQGYKTSIGDAFCSGETEKKDCNAVLTSKGAEILKGYKLSDLSLIYFSIISLLSLVLYPNTNFIKIVSLLSFPITLYSIYYQYAIVKKWCMLCLSIVAVLWFQVALSFNPLPNSLGLNLHNALIVVITASSVYLIWNYLKPSLTNLKKLEADKIEYIKFKRNYTLFDSLLTKSPSINTKLSNNKEIVFGNKDSNLEFVIVTNPFCGHCRPVHKLVDEILHRYSNQVKIIIRFNIATDNLESNTVLVTSRLLELYNTKGVSECLKAMNSIYNGKEVSAWINEFGKTDDINTYLDILKIEKEWCNNHSINFTPEILVNGKSYPKEYKREDLIFFIEELEESISQPVDLTA